MPSGYSGTPLVKKLGSKAATTVAVLGAPAGFGATLDDLPDDVRLVTRVSGTPDLIIRFLGSRRQLEGEMPRLARAMGQGLWIAWPKKSSGVRTDLTEDVIRAAGLAAGLVDYKVCAIDETWSGLKFARRKR